MAWPLPAGGGARNCISELGGPGPYNPLAQRPGHDPEIARHRSVDPLGRPPPSRSVPYTNLTLPTNTEVVLWVGPCAFKTPNQPIIKDVLQDTITVLQIST